MNAESKGPLSVIVERELPHPPEKVWRALTQPHLIGEWLMKNDFAPEQGRRFTLTADWGVVAGEVREVEPKRTLSYTWDTKDLRSVVTWTLTTTSTGTRLRMEQSGFRPDQQSYHRGATAGWPRFLAALQQVLERLDRTPPRPDHIEGGRMANGEPQRTPSEMIDERIGELGDWRGETLSRLRCLIRQAEPDVVEEWKWRGVPVWYRHGIICTGETYRKAVKMTFAKGASLDDPAGLFNASLDGNTRRAIDFREGDEIDEEALKALIRDAVTLNASNAETRRKSK